MNLNFAYSPIVLIVCVCVFNKLENNSYYEFNGWLGIGMGVPMSSLGNVASESIDSINYSEDKLTGKYIESVVRVACIEVFKYIMLVKSCILCTGVYIAAKTNH